MKILVFSRESDNLGGVVNYLNILKSGFNENIDVTDFTIGYRKGNTNALANMLQPLRDGFRLLYHLMSHSYDVIHLNPSLNRKSVLRDGLFLAILKLLRQDKIVVFLHGWDESFFCNIKKNRIYSWVFRRLFSCRKILVLASAFRTELIDLGFDQEKIEVVTTMFDGDLFAQATKKRYTGKFKILFLSRLIVEKGPYELLDAFADLILSNDNLRLVIAGDGPEFKRLKAQVEEKKLQRWVHMPGYIRDTVKANILLNSDLFILPTYYGEGCPVSLLEAMAAGLPVISSRVGGVPEIVESYRNGIILGSVSKDEIFKALSYCFKNPRFVCSAGEINRKEAWEKYESSVVTKKMENLYGEIASG